MHISKQYMPLLNQPQVNKAATFFERKIVAIAVTPDY